ncbi:uncharacterized protein LOC124194823 [Daphnia pulex]|uniref:uncharacterized protein LOC124194822 n=1 Tax=Daphnia pulex TaxID=6669 RepID=UPI001EE0A538|nr:uncharacterized protein LOC124194822 [Daphnia pulex]XP_046445164.1 uncharacterized protein LOC124194823 [Daphnia pulex]
MEWCGPGTDILVPMLTFVHDRRRTSTNILLHTYLCDACSSSFTASKHNLFDFTGDFASFWTTSVITSVRSYTPAVTHHRIMPRIILNYTTERLPFGSRTNWNELRAQFRFPSDHRRTRHQLHLQTVRHPTHGLVEIPQVIRECRAVLRCSPIAGLHQRRPRRNLPAGVAQWTVGFGRTLEQPQDTPPENSGYFKDCLQSTGDDCHFLRRGRNDFGKEPEGQKECEPIDFPGGRGAVTRYCGSSTY